MVGARVQQALEQTVLAEMAGSEMVVAAPPQDRVMVADLDGDLMGMLPASYPAKPTGFGTDNGQTTWSRERAVYVIQEVARGRTLSKIATDPGAPGPELFRKWAIRIPALAKMYVAARQMQAGALFDETLDVSRDNAAKPQSETKNGAVRILVQALQWAAGKLDPAAYGEKRDSMAPVQVNIITNLDIDQKALEAGRPDDTIDMEAVDGVYIVKAKVGGETTGASLTEPDGGTEATTKRPPRRRRPPGSRIGGMGLKQKRFSELGDAMKGPGVPDAKAR